MALLDFQQRVLAYNKIWGATVGASDLPSSGLPGDWTVGDLVMNLAPAYGSPISWVCTAVSTAGAPTFAASGLASGTTAAKTVAPPYTVTSADRVVISPAGAIALPASTSFPVGEIVYIHATGSSVTITPASGQINGASAVTLAANANAQVTTDGTTNWYSIG